MDSVALSPIARNTEPVIDFQQSVSNMRVSDAGGCTIEKTLNNYGSAIFNSSGMKSNLKQPSQQYNTNHKRALSTSLLNSKYTRSN